MKQGKHQPCIFPVGVSKIFGPPTWKFPPCVLSTQHIGPHVDKDGNKELLAFRR